MKSSWQHFSLFFSKNRYHFYLAHNNAPANSKTIVRLRVYKYSHKIYKFLLFSSAANQSFS